MQAIPGKIKALVILISNEMPDENTDQNATHPPYTLTTCFSVRFNPEQGIRDEFATGFKVSSKVVTECGTKASPNQENFLRKKD